MNFGRITTPLILVWGIFCSLACAESPSAPVILLKSDGTCLSSAEICGDGVDQDCDGQDTLCPGPDQDRDGFTSNDCDDSERSVYPGITTECTAACGTGTQQCQSNGSYSPCTCSPLCEAVGSGRCYYISALTGSDSNPGTFSAPWKTYLNIVSYYSSADRPASWRALAAGDVVYFMSGRYTTTYHHWADNDSALFIRNVQGTAGAPITLKAYPGARATFVPDHRAAAIFLLSSSYFNVEGFEIAGGWNGGLMLDTTSFVEAKNLTVHNVDGNVPENMAGIYLVAATDANIHHNIVYDNFDHARAPTNPGGGGNRDVSLFSGGNIHLHHNVIFHSRKELSGCVLYKHSQTVPGGIFEADHNILYNCEDASLSTGSYGSKIHHNLIIDSPSIILQDWGGPTKIVDVEIKNNTFVNVRGSALVYAPTTTYAPVGPVSFLNNVVVGNPATNTAADPYRVVNVGFYESDALYHQVMDSPTMTINRNCYYNAPITPVFGLFERNGGLYGVLGAAYPLAGWQLLGFDQNSFIADPALDQFFRPTNSNCADKGWLAP